VTHCFEVNYSHAKYQKPISKDKKVTTWTQNCHLKKQYFDLEVKGHKPWYTTHCLEVIYPYAKYQKLISKDKKVTAQKQFCYQWTD